MSNRNANDEVAGERAHGTGHPGATAPRVSEEARSATGELVTRPHFDTALAQLESRLAWRLVTAGIAIAAVVVAALRFLG